MVSTNSGGLRGRSAKVRFGYAAQKTQPRSTCGRCGTVPSIQIPRLFSLPVIALSSAIGPGVRRPTCSLQHYFSTKCSRQVRRSSCARRNLCRPRRLTNLPLPRGQVERIPRSGAGGYRCDAISRVPASQHVLKANARGIPATAHRHKHQRDHITTGSGKQLSHRDSCLRIGIANPGWPLCSPTLPPIASRDFLAPEKQTIFSPPGER